MGRNAKFSREQIVEALAAIDRGTSIPDMAKKLKVTPSNIYAWRKKYGVVSNKALPTPKDLPSPIDSRSLKDSSFKNWKDAEEVAALYKQIHLLNCQISQL